MRAHADSSIAAKPLGSKALGALSVAVAFALMPVAARAQDLLLMMIEQPGCIYCARWDAEIAPAYPLTEEGKAAPLVRQQLRADLPDGIVFDRPAAFTPTFVLLQDGIEVGRIEGYPGEDFFWPLLGTLIKAAQDGKSGDGKRGNGQSGNGQREDGPVDDAAD